MPCSEHSVLSSKDRVFRWIFSSRSPRTAELGAAGVSPGPAICNGRLPGNHPLLGSPPVDVALGGRGGSCSIALSQTGTQEHLCDKPARVVVVTYVGPHCSKEASGIVSLNL